MPGICSKYEFLNYTDKIAGYAPAYFMWVILVSLLFILRNIII